MSFSGKVKEELAGQLSLARHCQVAELAALLCGCGRVEKMSKKRELLLFFFYLKFQIFYLFKNSF